MRNTYRDERNLEEITVRRIFSVLLVAVLCIAAFAGCAGKADEPEISTTNQATAATEALAATEAPASTEAPAAVPVETFSDVPLTAINVSKDSVDYYQAAYDTEYVNYKIVRSIPTCIYHR